MHRGSSGGSQEELMTNATANTEPRKTTSIGEAHPVPAPKPIPGIDPGALAASARASKLIGSNVYRGDTSIGQIEDILVDLDHATVTGVILTLGGFLGIGDKLVAVPVDQIKVGSEARFVTNLTEAQFASAPAYDFGKN
jgi:sporulation protein YlmC with PRC-barrel domain